MLTKNCWYCSKEFSVLEYRKDTAHFCQIDCANKFRIGKPSGTKGRKMSDETREKLKYTFFKKGDRTRLGCKLTPEQYEKNKHTFCKKGEHRSIKTEFKKGDKSHYWKLQKYYSDGKDVWNKGTIGVMKPNSGTFNVPGGRKPDNSREKHWNWKNGITPFYLEVRQLPEYKKWKKMVIEKDGKVCQECGDNIHRLYAHHKKAFSKIMKEYNITTVSEAKLCEELWDVSLGQILCRPCHEKTDNYGGKNNSKILIKENNL